MSFSINISNLGIEEIDNLSINGLSDETIITTDEFDYWFNEEKVEYEEIEDTEDNRLDAVEEFKMSSAYNELEDNYYPMMNEVEITQKSICSEKTDLLHQFVPNVSALFISSLNTYALGLNAAGMDLSDNLELAYYIVDGKSPIKANEILSLSDKATDLLKWCRNEISNNNFVDFHSLKRYLNKIKNK